MLIFSINFNLYYFMLIGNFKDVRKNEELRVFLTIVLLSTVVISINTIDFHTNLGDCIRTAFFQVSSIISTAGFATTDYNLWPAVSQTIIVLLMFIGACAGSTTGALKLSRVILIVKGTMREIRHILRPRSVNIIRMDGVPVPEEIVRSAIGYLALHIIMLISTIFLISFDGYSFETNFTAALSCLNNIGPGLKEVGPVGNFAGYSLLSQFMLALIMILGRLEIIPMLVLLSPDTWRKMFGQKESAKIRKLQRIRRSSESTQTNPSSRK
jgi:trk system potassium uptake protein TrkH